MDKVREVCDLLENVTMVDESQEISDDKAMLNFSYKKGVFTFQGMPDNYRLNWTTFKFDIEQAKVLRDLLNTAIVLTENYMMED